MRLASVAVGVIVLIVAVGAQTTESQIRGTLSSARGPLANVEVRVKNTASGEVRLSTTSREGEYALSLPPGTYDVFATPVGYVPFTRRQVVVRTGDTPHIDGVLGDNPNAGTPGEISFLYERDERRPPSGAVPRTASGKPDLSGAWFPGPDLEPEVTPFQPWAEAVARQRATRPGDDPRAQCLPSGVVRTNNLDLAKFVQTPELLILMVEGSVPGVRQIFLDGRGHPKDLQPTWLGHSIGTWDEDTLIVETTGFNDKGWLDNGGRPQTERLHVTERFRRRDLGHLEVEITIDDPGAYTRPWKVHRLLTLAPHEEILEYVCNENNRTEHFVAH